MIVQTNPEGIHWSVEILPWLESWDESLAWVHDHRPVFVGL